MVGKGWFKESHRHSLAARGIRSSSLLVARGQARSFRCWLDLEDLGGTPDEHLVRLLRFSGVDDVVVVAGSEREARGLALVRAYGYLRNKVGVDPVLLQQEARRILPRILECEEVEE